MSNNWNVLNSSNRMQQLMYHRSNRKLARICWVHYSNCDYRYRAIYRYYRPNLSPNIIEVTTG